MLSVAPIISPKVGPGFASSKQNSDTLCKKILQSKDPLYLHTIFFLIENIKICVASNSNTQSHYYLLLAPFQIQTRICIFIIACIAAADRPSCTIITKEFLQGVEILG